MEQTIRTSSQMLDALQLMAGALGTDEGNAMLAESVHTTNEELFDLVMILMPVIALQIASGGALEGAFVFAIQVGIAIANDAA